MATVLYAPAFVVITAWFERKRTRAMMIVTLMAGLASIAVYTHLIAYMHDRGFEPTLAASLAGLVGAMQVMGRIILRALGGRVPLRENAAVVLGLQPLAFVVLLLVPGLIGLAVFVSLIGASRGTVTLVRPAVAGAARRAGARPRARAARVISARSLRGPRVTVLR